MNIFRPLNIAIIGRTEILYKTALLLREQGYNIVLVVTSKEVPEYTKTSKDFEKLANDIGAFFIYSPKVSAQDIKDVGHKLHMDLAISINYSGVIPQEVIDLFPMGILNAHGGDLPRYRGNACQAWAIINGEEKIGLCIHKMIGGELDSGNILLKKHFHLHTNTRLQEVYDWFESVIPTMMLEVANLLATDGNYLGEIQSKNPKDALRCYPRNPEDGRIDWQKSSIEILRLINASSEPYSGAFCEYESEKMTIWRAKIYEDEEVYLAVSGQVAEIQKATGNIIIITGKGKILIEEVTYQNERQKPAKIIKSIRKRLK